MAKVTEKIKAGLGLLEWVNISGEGEENMSGNLQYLASIRYSNDSPEFARLQQQIQDFWEANKPKNKRKPKSNGIYFGDFEKDEEGNFERDEDDKKIPIKDGDMVLTFKTGTTWPDGKTKIVRTYNARGKSVVLGETKIGNGSKGCIEGTLGIYENKDKQGNVLDAGVSLYLDKIQIVRLEEYQGDEAEFESYEEEDGFTGESEDTFEGTEDGATESNETTAKPRL